MLAACAGDLCEVFGLLLSGVDVNKTHENGPRSLCILESELRNRLLDSGAEPNIHQSCEMVETPLSTADGSGSFEIVRLAHNADPNCYSGVAAGRAEAYAQRGGHHGISEFFLYHEDRRHIQRDLQ